MFKMQNPNDIESDFQVMDEKLHEILNSARETDFLMAPQISAYADTTLMLEKMHYIQIPVSMLPSAIIRHPSDANKSLNIPIKKNDLYEIPGGIDSRRKVLVNGEDITMYLSSPSENKFSKRVLKFSDYLSTYELNKPEVTFSILSANTKKYDAWDSIAKPGFKSEIVRPILAYYVLRNGFASAELNISDIQTVTADKKAMHDKIKSLTLPNIIRFCEVMVFACSFNWYITNHYTGTENTSPFIIKVMNMMGALKDDLTDEDLKLARSDIHNMFHCFSARNVLSVLFPNEITALLISGFPLPKRAALDNFFTLRMSAFPAGTHKVSNAIACLNVISNMRLSLVYPRFNKGVSILQEYDRIRKNRAAFHIGSIYLTRNPENNGIHENVLISEDVCMEIMADSLHMFKTIMNNHSLAKSPIIKNAPIEKIHPVWKTVVAAYQALVANVPESITANINKLLSGMSVDISGIKKASIVSMAQKENERISNEYSDAYFKIMSGKEADMSGLNFSPYVLNAVEIAREFYTLSTEYDLKQKAVREDAHARAADSDPAQKALIIAKMNQDLESLREEYLPKLKKLEMEMNEADENKHYLTSAIGSSEGKNLVHVGYSEKKALEDVEAEHDVRRDDVKEFEGHTGM